MRKIFFAVLGIAALITIFYPRKKVANIAPVFNKSIEVSQTQPAVTELLENGSSAPAQGDRVFTLLLEDIYDAHPWLNKLPIDTSEYFIVWELDNNQFRIRLKMSSQSSQAVKDALLQKALTNLKQVTNDDLTDYKYHVMYLD